MAIRIRLDHVLYERRMSMSELADRVGVTEANLALLRAGQARALRFTTLDALCAALACQPGDLLRFDHGPTDSDDDDPDDDTVS